MLVVETIANPPSVFCYEEAHQGDLSKSACIAESGSEGYPVGCDGVALERESRPAQDRALARSA